MTFDPQTLKAAEDLLAACRERKLMLVTAESCTGGLLAGALTAIAGSSDAVFGGLVTYANEAKMNWLNVPSETLEQFGAVSAETAAAMAQGAALSAQAALSAHGLLALSTTGIAGPGGGSAEKPVGLVYVGTFMLPPNPASAQRRMAKTRRLDLGDIGRDAVRRETVQQALRLGLAYVVGTAVDTA